VTKAELVEMIIELDKKIQKRLKKSPDYWIKCDELSARHLLYLEGFSPEEIEEQLKTRFKEMNS
jgi:hypothetical protein